MSRRVLRTELCDMLGIEYPILSAGMGPSLIGETTGAPVELVVAVSEETGTISLAVEGQLLRPLDETTLRNALAEHIFQLRPAEEMTE